MQQGRQLLRVGHVRIQPHVLSGSCTGPLRIIISPPKLGTMPPTQPVLEGARPWFHTCFTTNALCWLSSGSASCCLAAGPGATSPRLPCQPRPASPSASVLPSPKRSRVCRTSLPVPCVSERLARLLQRPRPGPIPCRQHTDAPGPWTPRGTFVRTATVPSAAGWG
jgi:hypothetical protein